MYPRASGALGPQGDTVASEPHRPRTRGRMTTKSPSGPKCEGCLIREKTRAPHGAPVQVPGKGGCETLAFRKNNWTVKTMTHKTGFCTDVRAGCGHWGRGWSLGSHRPAVEFRHRPRSCGFSRVALVKVTISFRLRGTTCHSLYARTWPVASAE